MRKKSPFFGASFFWNVRSFAKTGSGRTTGKIQQMAFICSGQTSPWSLSSCLTRMRSRVMVSRTKMALCLSVFSSQEFNACVGAMIYLFISDSFI